MKVLELTRFDIANIINALNNYDVVYFKFSIKTNDSCKVLDKRNDTGCFGHTTENGWVTAFYNKNTTNNSSALRYLADKGVI